MCYFRSQQERNLPVFLRNLWHKGPKCLLALLAAAALTLPASADPVFWSLGQDGNWNAAGAWGVSTPGPSDDVENDTHYAITFSQGISIINSFLSSLDGVFNMTGGQLTVNTSFTSNGVVNLLGGTLSGGALNGNGLPVSTFQVNNTTTLNGGTLSNFIVNAGSDGQGITVGSSSSALVNVLLNANLSMTNGGNLYVTSSALNSSQINVPGGRKTSFLNKYSFGGG